MFTLHCRAKDTMFTVRVRNGAKAWRLMQLNRREGWTVRLYGPNGLIDA